MSLIAAAVLIIGAWWFLDSRSAKSLAKAPPAAATPTNPLAAEKRADILYTLPVQQQKTLLKTVEFFCVKAYHRESCVHYLITCGPPCFIAIPKEKRVQIFNDYQILRKQAGMPQLLKLPPKPEDED
jgi:hypothetical protein